MIGPRAGQSPLVLSPGRLVPWLRIAPCKKCGVATICPIFWGSDLDIPGGFFLVAMVFRHFQVAIGCWGCWRRAKKSWTSRPNWKWSATGCGAVIWPGKLGIWHGIQPSRWSGQTQKRESPSVAVEHVFLRDLWEDGVLERGAHERVLFAHNHPTMI